MSSPSKASQSSEDSLADSWVDLGKMSQSDSDSCSDKSSSPERIPSPVRISSPRSNVFGVSLSPADYMRLLEEAQRESSLSSRDNSNKSSPRLSPAYSPKEISPNKSPVGEEPEAYTEEEFNPDSLYINFCENKELDLPAIPELRDTDWIWNWSSMPDRDNPFCDDFTTMVSKFSHPSCARSHNNGGSDISEINSSMSIRQQPKLGKSSNFPKDVFYTVIFSNIVSLLVGVGIGMWIARKALVAAQISLD